MPKKTADTVDNTYKGYLPKTAEENYVFNTKREIPANKQVGFKDGNPKNILFSNLILVDKAENKKDNQSKEDKTKTPSQMNKTELEEALTKLKVDFSKAKNNKEKADLLREALEKK